MNNPYNILIAISILIILSYLFNLISGKLKVPSVILLLLTGIGLQFISNETGYNFPETKLPLELLGIIGLIFIVLEGALDLKITRQKLPLIGRSFTSAFLILIATSGLISWILIEFVDLPLKSAVIYAVPLGVISSAIAIPSVHKLSEDKKEFIVYESTFSDIIGIMLFNYIIIGNITSGSSIISFFINLFTILIVSAISTGLLLFFLNYIKLHIKFYLIFAILILIYSFSKMFHLSPLLFILIFGLMLNNANLFIKGRLANYLQLEKLQSVTKELSSITAETAFIVRTFFFILFGYSINLHLLLDWNVVLIGSLITIAILLIRFILLRFISKSNVFPEIFIAPRGLITIVLFYSIPSEFQANTFNEGILFFVIITSSVMMMIGIMVSKSAYNEKPEDLI
ncbi:MAG: cation:proton antiporter [Bacteroidetes bacterium]|nr:cation:proton antiporter [Bacteroidota bacterium]